MLVRLVTLDRLASKDLFCEGIGLAMGILMPAVVAGVGATIAEAEKEGPRVVLLPLDGMLPMRPVA